MSFIDQLHDAVFNVTPLVLKEEYAHMKTPWQMVLGGLILPELVKHDPTVLDADPAYKTLMEQYSREQVIEFFSPKVETKEVIKEVDKIVYETKIVDRVVEKIVHDHTVPMTVVSEGKFRRLKSGVAKIKRFERDLDATDRDAIIRWWNSNQRLLTDEDPACKDISDVLNRTRPTIKPLSPMQVAGYFSYLCRLGQWDTHTREARIDRTILRGSFTIKPVYSPKLIAEIIKNWETERADEAARKAAHKALAEARARGEKLTIKHPRSTVVGTLSTPAPAPAPVEEEFDIKFM